jgi:glycosyltransferase involved in cell wall biosynthesis
VIRLKTFTLRLWRRVRTGEPADLGMLRVAAYTGGVNVASARFRVRQYIPLLPELGVEMREFPARFGSFPPENRWLRPVWGLATVAERFGSAFHSHDADLTLLQREMVSTLATAERFTKAPRVLDVDDAIWLSRNGQSAIAIARMCHTVICGNSFLAEFFRAHAPNVAVLPTPVDTDRFRPAPAGRRRPGVICWSGTSGGKRFLNAIEKPLARVLAGDRGRLLKVVSDSPPRLPALPSQQIQFVPWSEEVEVAAIQDASLGIMPLDESEWSRGKCSFKLLSYMSCGLPVVATPVGMNAEVLSRGPIGLAARTPAEWVEAIESVLSDPKRSDAMGTAGREVVLRDYDLKNGAIRLASILEGVARS